MRAFCVLLIGAALAGCSAHGLRDEPADLIGNGRNLAQLVQLGWTISEPRSLQEVELLVAEYPMDWAGQPWRAFAGSVVPGDELRQVANNAGVGIGLFRNGQLVDTYLWTII